jgi:hypothetical protein
LHILWRAMEDALSHSNGLMGVLLSYPKAIIEERTDPTATEPKNAR